MSDDKKEHPYIDELARDARGVCYNAFAKLIERADVIEEELLYSNAQLKDAITERDAALEREQALWETLIKIADHLDIDYTEARKQSGKPSDVYIGAINKRDLIKQAEGAIAVRHLTQGEDWEDDELRIVIDDYIATLRQQAEAQDD